VKPPRPRPSLGLWGRALIALAFAGGLFAADIATKTWAEYELRRHGARTLLGEFLVLRYQTNSGIAFGLFRAPIVHWKRTALITYSSLVTIGVGLVLARRLADPNATLLTTAGVTALLAGSGGNLRDRIVRGAVIDFLDLQPPGGGSWPAFNLADLYLAVGLVLCIAGLGRAMWRDWHADDPPPA
jgi:signal peptidase II